MSLTNDLNAIKTVQDGVKNNKVTRFAYTQTAYDNNDVNGHDDYVATRDNNIPLSDLSVIEVNPTVVDKGFRARASALNRMFLNHLFGRISYNLNKVNDLFNDLLVKIVANLGVADGLATLDSTGRIPYSQLPEDAMEYQGDWNASTNTPALVDGTGTKGDTYNVSVAGTQTFGGVSVHFAVGDRVIYNGSVWQKFASGDVQSVCEILPDPATANVDLSQQADISKVLNSNFLSKILLPLYYLLWTKGVFNNTANYVTGWTEIAKGNGIMCALASGAVYVSTDEGRTWTKSTLNLSDPRHLIFAQGSFWVTDHAERGGLFTSANGTSWSQPLPQGSYEGLYGDDDVIITTNLQRYYVYRNGSWGDVGTTVSNQLSFVRYGNKIISNYCYQYDLTTSTWSRLPSTVNNGQIIVTDGNILLIGCYSNNGIWRSTNGGSTWTKVLSVNDFVYAITHGGDKWVTFASRKFYYSYDGATWYEGTTTTGSGITSMSIIYTGKVWLATTTDKGGVTHYAEVFISYDGINWQKRSVPISINALAYINGKVFGAGGNLSGTPKVIYSGEEEMLEYLNGE